MKCPKCNGTGIDDDRLICYECGGTGEYEPFDTDVELDKLYPTEQTNEEWLRSATFEELAGAIYEWHTKGYARGRLEVDLNPITEVVEWLKQPHTDDKEM